MRQIQLEIGVPLHEGDMVHIYRVRADFRKGVRLFGGPDLTGLHVAWII